MNKIAALTASLWVLGTSAYASEATFNEAVNLYLKGYADCREANTLRTDDSKAARQLFDNYLKILDQATAIDPSILNTKERDMDANLTYCERVSSNLKMAEAAPVLEAGFTHCENAKTAMAGDDFATAQQEFDSYAVKRDEALAITGNIMEVFSLASQVRACGRLEEKLAEARQASQAEAAALASLGQQLNSYSQKCQSALAYTRQNTFTIDTIDQANRLLAEAQQFRKQANNNSTANRLLKANPALPEAGVLKQLEDAAGRCEVEVSTLIRNMSKQRQISEQTLETAISAFQQASNQCTKGQQLLAQSSASARNEAAQLSKQVRALLDQANTQTLAALAKRHPGWPQSKTWQQLNKDTNQCQQGLQVSLAKADSAAKPPAAVAPPVAKAITKPVAQPVAATPAADSPATPAAASVLPSEATAAGEPTPTRAKKGDWTELADDPEETAPAPASKQKQVRKSWTDLVQ